MPFSANISIRRTSQTALEVRDSSTYSGLTPSSFTERYLTIEDYSGATPSGFLAKIPFPFVNGYDDLIVLEFSEDLAFSLSITFVPVTPDATATFTVTELSSFMGFTKAISASRVHKCEIQGLVQKGYITKYRDATLILDAIIDNVAFLCSTGQLEAAQGLIDKIKSVDTETISID